MFDLKKLEGNYTVLEEHIGKAPTALFVALFLPLLFLVAFAYLNLRYILYFGFVLLTSAWLLCYGIFHLVKAITRQVKRILVK